jgi:hypothetical protein
MTLEEKKKVLTDYLSLKVLDCDWKNVSAVALDLKKLERLIKKSGAPVLHHANHMIATGPIQTTEELPAEFNKQATDKVQQVIDLLKLRDDELVNTIFPDGAGI